MLSNPKSCSSKVNSPLYITFISRLHLAPVSILVEYPERVSYVICIETNKYYN